jgi:hypothetical protein
MMADSIKACREAAKAGCIFYKFPDELEPADVDPLIQATVFAINRSEWVWTAESCQGHPDADEPFSWAHNVCPMLRLVTNRKSFGRLMEILASSYKDVAAKIESNVARDHVHIFELRGFRICPQVKYTGEWAEVLIYIDATNVYQRNQGLKVWSRFSELVNV